MKALQAGDCKVCECLYAEIEKSKPAECIKMLTLS